VGTGHEAQAKDQQRNAAAQAKAQPKEPAALALEGTSDSQAQSRAQRSVVDERVARLKAKKAARKEKKQQQALTLREPIVMEHITFDHCEAGSARSISTILETMEPVTDLSSEEGKEHSEAGTDEKPCGEELHSQQTEMLTPDSVEPDSTGKLVGLTPKQLATDQRCEAEDQESRVEQLHRIAHHKLDFAESGEDSAQNEPLAPRHLGEWPETTDEELEDQCDAHSENDLESERAGDGEDFLGRSDRGAGWRSWSSQTSGQEEPGWFSDEKWWGKKNQPAHPMEDDWMTPFDELIGGMSFIVNSSVEVQELPQIHNSPLSAICIWKQGMAGDAPWCNDPHKSADSGYVYTNGDHVFKSVPSANGQSLFTDGKQLYASVCVMLAQTGAMEDLSCWGNHGSVPAQQGSVSDHFCLIPDSDDEGYSSSCDWI